VTWPRSKLKFVARFGYGDALPVDEAQRGPFQVFGSNGSYASFSRSNTRAPAVVIGRKGSYGKVNWTPEPCFASDTTFFIDSSTTRHNLRWIYWALQTLQLDEGNHEAAVPGLNRETAYSKDVAVPPVHVQRAIADYLDHETARLDALVAAKVRLLDLLEEKRRALITRAVTRGLDPSAPLRDSGISWLGEIPAHWGTRRVAWLFKDRDERGEPDLPLLEVSINLGVILREFSTDKIESTAADFNTYKVARTGDVVFNKMRMWQGAVGVAPEDGLVSPDYTVAAPTGLISSEYAGLLFRTDIFSAECARRSHGIVWDRLRLYWDGFREIELPLPSLDEQSEIVAHIAEETGKLDALRLAAERTIALLKERRAALIAAAVTGRLNVNETGLRV
jgi:type I restriction enzyme, S subunit